MRTLTAAFALTIALLGSARSQELADAQRAFSHGLYVRSAQMFLRKATQGSPLAQTFLGYQYQTGWGVPKSYQEAAYWFGLAAEQGEPTSQFFLGLLLDRGQGVSEDPIEAVKWLDLAAAHAPTARREYWLNMRDNISSKLTRAELAEAHRRAVAWAPVLTR